jgi:hypothetical protein
VYEGETFAEADMLQYEEGVTTSSPPAYDHGQVPVFDQLRQCWEVIPVTVARQLLNISPPHAKESNL